MIGMVFELKEELLMKMTNERVGEYTDSDKVQLDKVSSVSISETLVRKIKDFILPLVENCKAHEPNDDLRIAGAPGVKTGNKFVVAPDLKCETRNSTIFWTEVKDKCQRFFLPDMGADIHQVLGCYDINKHNNESVIKIFQDPPFQDCIVAGNDPQWYRSRWDKFLENPYSNLLSKLAQLNNSKQYPMLSPQRSRYDSMNISDFHIDIIILLDLDKLKNLISQVGKKSINYKYSGKPQRSQK